MEFAEARAKTARARQLAATATRRERQHIEIAAAAIEGQPGAGFDRRRTASRRVSSRCARPFAFARRLRPLRIFRRADHDAARVAICERHAKQYGEDWWFLTYLGWSHTEAGNVGVGRTLTERAIAIRHENANAAHALSHALFEQGDTVTGRIFLSDWLPAHDRASFLHGHLSWHIALTALDAGDLDGALKIYEQQIRPSDSRYPPMIVFTDCSRAACGGFRSPARPVWSPIGRKSPLMATGSSRRRARTLPMSITPWSQRQPAAGCWKPD